MSESERFARNSPHEGGIEKVQAKRLTLYHLSLWVSVAADSRRYRLIRKFGTPPSCLFIGRKNEQARKTSDEARATKFVVLGGWIGAALGRVGAVARATDNRKLAAC